MLGLKSSKYIFHTVTRGNMAANHFYDPVVCARLQESSG